VTRVERRDAPPTSLAELSVIMLPL
jgi:hypothetical protein